MDLMTALIGIFLVWTGACFFGYPIGRIMGKRKALDTIADEYALIPKAFWKSSINSGDSDDSEILNAEIIEEVK